MTYPSAALATAADRLSLDFELGHMNDIASREERGDYRLACDHLDRAYPCAENLRRQPLATTPKGGLSLSPGPRKTRRRPPSAPGASRGTGWWERAWEPGRNELAEQREPGLVVTGHNPRRR